MQGGGNVHSCEAPVVNEPRSLREQRRGRGNMHQQQHPYVTHAHLCIPRARFVLSYFKILFIYLREHTCACARESTAGGAGVQEEREKQTRDLIPGPWDHGPT